MRPTLLSVRPRALAMLVVTALLAGLLAVVAIAQPAAADSVISVSAKAPTSVLSGAPATVTLTAKNSTSTSSGTALYNLGYSYTLPPGVSYVAGSATADGQTLPDPVQSSLANNAGTLLVFSNVSDLVAGDQKSIAFRVMPSTTTFPVGTSFTGTAQVAGSGDARMVPTFDGTGKPATNTTNSATATSNATAVSAITVSKAEASPEHELVRGVHAHPTVYTLTVQNTATAPSNNVTVTDYLPAGLEFLQCGGVDNTTTGPEYPGAPDLTAATSTNATGTLTTANCATPVSVSTVDNVPGQGAAVFTKVVWNIAQLTNTPVTIQYLAAVPLRSNTMTFRSGSATAPARTSAALASTANLDNNTGASTRQNGASTTSNGQSEQNLVTAAGTYTGTVGGTATAAQSASDSMTVEAMDLAVAKSVDTGTSGNVFAAGKQATYSLLVRTSEYESSQGITLTDTIPDGLCPAFPAGTKTTGTFPADCDPNQVSSLDQPMTNATVDSVAYDASAGTFTMAFHIADQQTDGSLTVSYKALMRTAYSVTGSGGPTAAGDRFTNTVQMQGTSTGVHGDTGTTAVADDSQASIVSNSPAIAKAVLPRSQSNGVTKASDCTASTRTGYTTTTPSEAFQLGDVVCFRLRVDFPAGVQSRNATVTDMLPVGTSAAGSSWAEGTDWTYGTESTVPQSDVALTSSSSTTGSFAVGHKVGGATGTYVDGDGQAVSLVLYVAAKIGAQGSSATKPDIVANLMKFAQQNTAGSVTSLRSQVGYTVAGTPTATLAKDIVLADGSTVSNPANTVEGQKLGYRLTVGNTPASGTSNDIANVVVWDALPTNVTCAMITTISDAGSCGAAPTGAATKYANNAYLVWTIPSIAASATKTLTYDFTVPTPGYVGTAFVNNASVVSFTTATDSGASTTWIPKRGANSTSSSTAGTGQGTAPQADKQRSIAIPGVAVTKTGAATSGSSTNLSGDTAAPGQALQYTYSATVPSKSSVASATLVDPLPSGVAITSDSSWTLTFPDGTTTITVPASAQGTDVTGTWNGQTYTLTGTSSRAGDVVFPSTFDNTTGAAATFTVTVTGLRASAGVGNFPTGAGSGFSTASLANTATFTSTPRGGTKYSASATKTIAVQAPQLGVTKTDDLGGRTVAGGDTVTWTLTAKNTAGSAESRSTIVADCFPDALTLTSSSSAETTLTDAQQAAFGSCPSGTTVHAWDVGTLAAGASKTITVVATVKQDAPAGQTYRNTARVLGSSLTTDYATANRSYVQVAQATDDVTVSGPSIVKTLTTPTWDATTGASTGTTTTDPSRTDAAAVRPGDAATYTLTTTIPANVALFDAQVTDVVPAGLSPSGPPSVSVSGSGVTASVRVSGNTVTVSVSDITTGLDHAVTVTTEIPVTVGADQRAGATSSNQATFAWDRSSKGAAPTDASTTSNPANATVVAPSLAIAKTAKVGSQTGTDVKAEPGQTITYTVTTTDTGSPAYGTAVTDCVPAGIVVDDSSLEADRAQRDTDASCPGGRITWPSAVIGAGATVTHTYTATLADDVTLTGAALVNTASTGTYRSLSSGGASYQEASATAKVTPAFPSVAVTKSNDTVGGLSYVGVPSDFSVTFTNTGSAAASVSAKDVLPDNWRYQRGSATVARDGGAAAAVADPSVSGSTLTWSDLGTLGANSTLVLRYRAVPGTDATRDPGAGTSVAHTNHVTATATSASGGTGSAKGSFVTYPGGGDDASAVARIAAADLAVTKTATKRQVVAGATTAKAWTIQIANTGDDAAHGTTVVDRTPALPDGAALAFSGSGWTCTPVDGGWSCVNGATVAAGSSFPELDVALTLPADAALDPITNTATIAQGTGQTFDPDATNDRDSATVTPVAIADLALTKTGPASVRAGGTVSWTLDVRNLRDPSEQSTSDARGTVTVSDTLPDTVTAVDASGDGWDCTVAGNTVTCTRDGLASGTGAPVITVVATVHADVTRDQTVDNTAEVAVDPERTTDPNTANDTDDATSTVDDSTTLTIAKASDGTLVAGSTADWTITVTDTGTADARHVQVTDALGSGTELAGSGAQTDGGWTCDAPTGSRDRVTCDLDGTLAAGKSTTFTLTVSTPSSLDGRLDNTAVVTADNAVTQSALANSDATQTAGLSVEKTADVRTVDAGRDVTYTITVANPDGPSDLPAGDATTPSVRVQDTLPAGVDFVGLDAATAQHWTLESNTGRVLTLTSTDGIAAGATDPDAIVLTVHVPASTDAGDLVNTVTAAPVTAKGATAQDDATVTVTTHAGLSIVKERTSAPTADAGTEVTYDVTVHNDGPSDAQHAVWSDTAPTGMTVTKVTTDADSWERGADVTTWSTDTFAAGDTAVFHVTAAIASGTPAGTLRNVAAVSSATSDPNSDDDRSGADVEVTTHASLGLTKTPVAAVGETAAVKTVTAGTDQVWMLQVHNAGPSDAQPTTVVTDDLPAGLTFRSATGAGWSCDATTTPGAVVCDLSSTVVAGQDAPALWLTTAVASGYTSDALVNTARVTASGTPSAPGTNGSAESPITVGRTANVAITIGHTGTAVIGKDLPETIQVRNDGSSDADAVTVTYTLPKGLTYVSTEADPRWAVASVEEHADGTTTVTFTLDGPLVAGTLAPAITVHQTVTADAYPGVEPTATVTTTTSETTTEDNDDADEIAVAPASALSVTKTHTGAVVRGKTVGYTVTVRNDGLTEDPGPVVVTDRLPAGLTLVSVDDGGAATCTDGRTVACTLTEALPVDSAVAFQITVRVADDAPDRITNTASVSTPTLQSESSAQTLRPGDPTRVSDPAAVSGQPRGDLAFTGAAGLGLGALIALLALAAGGVLLVLRRRRRA
ncbi:isopeptide-forming domain-containing fimbrial protein [Curtobacterium sp. DN_7.5]|uniref:isopeptide-forming domain-containing fimbrial protein n=1 Tax=Curtobacterium sp. DN_7.5 TaxID=3049047 RepID=UPI001F568413|nr:isopeptide-forming domain-containing fimbrial protein [Curtobacterium sp. DN_7.5]